MTCKSGMKMTVVTASGWGSWSKGMWRPPRREFERVLALDVNHLAAQTHLAAIAVGVGSSLVNQSLLDVNDFPELTRRARAFREAAVPPQR